jgi:hypothetical protein
MKTLSSRKTKGEPEFRGDKALCGVDDSGHPLPTGLCVGIAAVLVSIHTAHQVPQQTTDGFKVSALHLTPNNTATVQQDGVGAAEKGKPLQHPHATREHGAWLTNHLLYTCTGVESPADSRACGDESHNQRAMSGHTVGKGCHSS